MYRLLLPNVFTERFLCISAFLDAKPKRHFALETAFGLRHCCVHIFFRNNEVLSFRLLPQQLLDDELLDYLVLDLAISAGLRNATRTHAARIDQVIGLSHYLCPRNINAVDGYGRAVKLLRQGSRGECGNY